MQSSVGIKRNYLLKLQNKKSKHQQFFVITTRICIRAPDIKIYLFVQMAKKVSLPIIR